MRSLPSTRRVLIAITVLVLAVPIMALGVARFAAARRETTSRVAAAPRTGPPR